MSGIFTEGKVLNALDVMWILATAKYIHSSDEGIRETAKRTLPYLEPHLQTIVRERYIDSNQPLKNLGVALNKLN